MPRIIPKKIISGRNIGSRGAQGLPGDNPPLGPQGINPVGLTGDLGTPGPTCACRLDEDIPEVKATGANHNDYLSYNDSNQKWEKTTPQANSLNLNQIDFSNIPKYNDVLTARDQISQGYLYLIDNDLRARMPDDFYAFQMEMNVTDNVTIPVVSTTSDLIVDWGDDTRETISSPVTSLTHTYSSPGSYRVIIIGDVSVRFNGALSDTLVTSVNRWGDKFVLDDNAFNGCTNLDLANVIGIPKNFETNLQGVFRFCNSITSIPNFTSWDLSKVTQMNLMFDTNEELNQDMIGLDLSSCTNMGVMFARCYKFNGDLSNWVLNTDPGANINAIWMFQNCTIFEGIGVDTWNTERISSFYGLFQSCPQFNNQNLSNWDVSNAGTMRLMFSNCDSFNSDIIGWSPTGCIDFQDMFSGSAIFNGDLSNWTFSSDPGVNITMQSMFNNCPNFGGTGLETWNTERVTNMSSMFNSCSSFNQDISSWNVSSATTMQLMFNNCDSFNSDIIGWSPTGCTNFQNLLSNCAIFDGDLSNWTFNPSPVMDAQSMFSTSPQFTGRGLSTWDVTNFTKLNSMFQRTNFGGNTGASSDISGWTPINCTTMNRMFEDCSNFNQDISGWDVSNVKDMQLMFSGATNFDQDLGASGQTGQTGIGWNVKNVTDMTNMFSGVELSTFNYDSLLLHWAYHPDGLQSGVNFHGGNSVPSPTGPAALAREYIVDTYGWTITDGGIDSPLSP